MLNQTAMSKKFVQLEPKYLLDEEWKLSRPISGLRHPLLEKSAGSLTKEDLKALTEEDLKALTEEDLKAITEAITIEGRVSLAPIEAMLEMEDKMLTRLIRSIRIEVAEVAETKEIGSEGKYEYLKSELGMNIILPKGSIAEMRFNVALMPEGEVVAIDGFPKDVIGEKEIVGGKIKVRISKAFKFIPVVGSLLAELFEIELNPWEFKLGNLKRVNVDFSGGLTSHPEWYFREDGIKNDLRVALTIRKPKSMGYIDSEVMAAWLYDPGFPRKTRVGTDAKTIKIY